jgi:NADH dehydrogenase (ubiquinone) 1 beta subcomplex subunit 9
LGHDAEFVFFSLVVFKYKMSSPAQVVHRLKVQSLYKRSLKLSLDWYIQRDLWRQQALHIRARFEENKNVTSPKELADLVKQTEKELEEWAHPDPYKCKLNDYNYLSFNFFFFSIVPLGPEGTKWERNLPPIVVRSKEM